MLLQRVAFLCFLCLFADQVSAQSDRPATTPEVAVATDDSDALKGLKGFKVAASILSDQADASKIQNRVELKLRQNGILVGDDQLPVLLIDCIALDEHITRVIAYTCSVRVVQLVLQTHPAELRVQAITWITQGVYSVGWSKYPESIVTKVDDLCDRFLNSWLKANPK